MDNIQKGAFVALISVVALVSVYVIHVFNSESARLEAEEEAEAARLEAEEEYYNMCSEWYNNMENWRADLNGRQGSLGGTLDLDGSMASGWNRFNLEVDRYNAECAS